MSAFSIDVECAVARADVCAAVDRLYGEVRAEIDARRPVCVASGECCHFEEYGHRLYVTTVEMAAFVRGLREIRATRAGYEADHARPPGGGGRRIPLAVRPVELHEPGCVFQVGGLCSVHAIRPFGCRMFFCDPTSSEWQNGQYERFHAELKRLHESLSVPYYYIEWRQALRECLDSADAPQEML